MARALAAEADILILDEPTAALDWHNQALLMGVLAELAADGITVLVSTHAPQHALDFASHVLLIFDGSRHGFGPPAQVMDEAALSALYRLPVCRVPLAAVVGGFVLLVVLGAVLGGVLGALLVLIAAAAVGWLAYLGWPVLTPVERLMRAAVILLLVAVALVAGVSHRLLF